MVDSGPLSFVTPPKAVTLFGANWLGRLSDASLFGRSGSPIQA
ncbi:hypothetical protein [Hansschlegelia beijingensis]|uniref:Uncharacterized protein n=1 Tax=Hansschlegelia beijingensis TaxID=1133344 RepID=A0A7W6D4Y1_9HYPH|nr:hypothetical protein [Hansschlegelia beijingensis]MBB3974681.1 hypothetical protein [Hansschlegelia beijingensis]